MIDRVEIGPAGRVRGRVLTVWLLLLACYAGTLGVPAVRGERLADDEAHALLVAHSLATDLDLDVRDERTGEVWRRWRDKAPSAREREVTGRLRDPAGIGFPALLAPAYRVGGRLGAELEMAALLAAAFALGVPLARRLVPEPWATGGILLVGLSPPALAA